MSTQVESLRRFLARRGPAPGGAGGSTLVVGSGKGGVGTSTLAALLALRAAEDGRSVLLVDAEEGPGTLHLLLGVETGPGLAALRGGAVTPQDLMVPVTDGLMLVTGWSAGSELGAALGAAERRALLRRVAGLYDGFDLVVVDAGSRLEGVIAACAAGARMLLAVTAVDRVALAATHSLVKVAALRTPRTPVGVLFNGCEDPEARGAFEILQAGVEHFLARSIDFAGAVPDDPGLRQAIADGCALQHAMPASHAADAVRGLDARVLFEGFAGPKLARAVTIPQARG